MNKGDRVKVTYKGATRDAVYQRVSPQGGHIVRVGNTEARVDSVTPDAEANLTPAQKAALARLPLPLEMWNRLDVKTRRALVGKGLVVDCFGQIQRKQET